MANTVAYTSTNSPTGSLKKGVISINLNNQIIGQNYNWRNGIVFQNQYIIYSDTFTQGIDTEANAKPCAWSCDYNDTALLNLINSLPPLIGQAKYSTLADAIAWLEGQNKYFIVNQNYPTIVTDELQFMFDVGLTGCYPLVGTSCYDASGAGSNTGLAYNSPVFNNSGSTSYFAFDGADDYIDFGTSANLNIRTFDFSQTVNFYINTAPTGGYRLTFKRLGGLGNGYSMYVTNSSQLGFEILTPATNVLINAGSIANGRWNQGTFVFDRDGISRLYLNGVEVGTGDFSSLNGQDISNTEVYTLGAVMPSIGGAYLNGRLGKVLQYKKALSPSEVLQNYYQGPIVTSGLVAVYDSGNLVSYPGTSTTWYDIKGTDNGTLNNGVYYTINEGGILNFDGTDDYVQTSSTLGNLGSGDWTFSVWWKANGTQSDFTSLISQGFTGGISSGAWALKVKGTSVQNFINFSFATAFETITDVQTSTNANDGNWHNIVVKRSVNTCTLYMDGQSVGTFNVSGGFVFGTGAVTYIGYTPRDSAYILGNLGIIQKYTRALSDGEIIQNYGVYRNRFETNQAFATGGVVTTVIENGIRYRVHTFTSSGTLTVTNAGKMEVLSVAGGGGGGRGRGGGGGAGGYIYDTDYSVGTGNKTVTVGAGGAGGSVNSSTAPNGSNSVFDNLTSIGGGGGAGTLAVVNSALNGASGGSGGGGSGNSSTPGPGGVGGDGTASQGFKGGTSFSDNASYTAGGGGGGAGGEGNSSVLNNSGNGGVGRQNSISGSASFYAAGGGGGGDGSAIAGSGGSSIGGNGSSSTVGGNATVNTGSGGGGGAASQNGGAGGSGIVIIRYRI
jgi:hypothetical protein